MRSKLPTAIGVILAVVLCGAPGSDADVSRPKPHALGKEFASFQPPQHAAATDSASARIEEPTGVITLRQALALAYALAQALEKAPTSQHGRSVEEVVGVNERKISLLEI